jgi:hypothetical protein
LIHFGTHEVYPQISQIAQILRNRWLHFASAKIGALGGLT